MYSHADGKWLQISHPHPPPTPHTPPNKINQSINLPTPIHLIIYKNLN